MGEQLHLLPVATNLLEASNLTNVLEELERSLHLEEPGQRTLEESGYREGEEPGPRVMEEAGCRVVEEPGSRVVEEAGYIAGYRDSKEPGQSEGKVSGQSTRSRIRLQSLTETPVRGWI